MYYLQSRYYDSAVGRFISADDPSNMGVNGHLLSYNLFAYCENNPVNRTDGTGNVSWESTAKFGLVVMAVGLLMLATVATGGSALALASGGVVAATSAANATVAAGAAITGTSLIYASSNKGDNESKKSSSVGNMKKQVERGQAPKEVDSVHDAHVKGAPNQHPHVHFKDGTSLNRNGTIHDKKGGIPNITKSIAEWLTKNGWSLPK